MPDQADGLRSLFARRRPSLLIVAGSDPLKAAVALHFAREAAAGERATVLVDGTAGQVAMACDQPCRYELAHVIAGDVPLSDVLRALTPHLLLLPAARALSRFGAFTADEDARLAQAFSTGISRALVQARVQPEHEVAAHETQVDLIVVNAEAGHASRAVEAFGRDARVVVVASEQHGSLRGAYLEMKMLSQTQNLENFEIVVPRFDDEPVSGLVYSNLATTARRFLEIALTDGGSVLLPAPRAAAAAARTSLSQSTRAALIADAVPQATAANPPTPPNHDNEVPHAAVA